VQLTRRTLFVLVAVLVALAAAGAVYMRYRVDKAVAECDSPAPPEKPATPPPNLPGFQNGEACGPAGTPTSTGKKP
jgi:hypothetical protein